MVPFWDPAARSFPYMFPIPDCRVPGHQFLKFLVCWRLAQVRQHTQYQHQVLIRFNAISLSCFRQRVHNGTGLCSLYTVVEQSVLSAYYKGPDCILCQIIGDWDISIVQKCHELLL